MPNVAPNYAPAIEAFSRNFIEAQQRAQETKYRTDAHLIEAAKTNPQLWDDPRTMKAAESVYGKDAAKVVVESYKATTDPEHGAYGTLQALGLLLPEEYQRAQGTPEQPLPGPPAPTPGVIGSFARSLGIGGVEPSPTAPAVPPSYAGATKALVERAPAIPGGTVRIGPKGVTVSVAGKTQKEENETRFYRAVGQRQRELVDHGVAVDAALKVATSEAAAQADALGVLVPASARELATADTRRLIDRRTRIMQKEVDSAFAGEIAARTEAGQRAGRLAMPLTAEERIGRDVGALRTPEGKPLPAAEQTKEFLKRTTEAAGAESYAKGRGQAQAQSEVKAGERATEMKGLSGTLAAFVPVATQVLTSNVLTAKSGVQATRLYLESGEGNPGIAALRNLKGLIPRLTRAIGGDVGNLAIQEQEAYRIIVDGTWQTALEFVTNMLVLSLAVDRLAEQNAQRAGMKSTPGASQLYKSLSKQAEQTKDPALAAALQRYNRAFGTAPDERSYEDILNEYGYGRPGATP